MEVLDRYLQAVKFWLPKEQKQDILAELSDDIQSQIEEKEEELGRPLDRAEVEAILKKGGPPLMVAGRYMPQRYLIGPALFPIYWFVLKLSWACFFGPWLIIAIGIEIFASAGGHVSPVMAGLGEPFFLAALINFAAITGVFAMIERYSGKTGFLKDWNPSRLPVVRDPTRVPRSASISELSWDTMLLLWWVNVLRIPGVPGMEIKLAPGIQRVFFWPIVALLLCQGAIACINAFRPQLSQRRAAIRGVVNVLSLLVIGSLLAIWLTGGTFVSVTSSKLSSAQIMSAQTWITFMWSVMLLIWAAASYAARAFRDTRRAMGKQPPSNWALRLLTGE